MTANLSVGIDLGGTNLRAALFRDVAHTAAPVAELREAVGANREPVSVAERVAAMVAQLCDDAGREAGQTVPVGVAIAAMLRGSAQENPGHVAHAPNLSWREVPFAALVRERLGPGFPVFLYNDVNAITYGEYKAGAGVGVDDVLAVFVGTGVGGGFVAGGRLILGASLCAGEIGHFKVVYGDDARLCGCGMRGCVEAYVGGTHLQTRARAELLAGAESAAVRLAGFDAALVHPGHIDLAAAEGDRYALDLYAEIAPLLAATLGNAVNLLNPARLILGGGVLAHTPILREHVLTALELVVAPALIDALTVVEPALGDAAGTVGSAILATEEPPP